MVRMRTRVNDFSGSVSIPTPHVAQENTPFPVGINGIPALTLFQLCAKAFFTTTLELPNESEDELGPASFEVLFDGFVTLNFNTLDLNLIF